jgi:hypothetical protein
MARVPGPLNKRFQAPRQKSPAERGWIYVVMPASAASFGTRGLVKVRGAIDGHPIPQSVPRLEQGRNRCLPFVPSRTLTPSSPQREPLE